MLLALGHFDAEYLTIESGERTLTPEGESMSAVSSAIII